MVPEQTDEAQEAAEESAGRPEDPRGRGARGGELRRARQDRRAAPARPGAGLLHAGRER